MKLTTDKILEFQSSLIKVLSDSGSLQDLLDVAHKEFQRPMFIKGDGSRIYAITDHYDHNVHPKWSVFLQNLRSDTVESESVRTVSEDPEFSRVFSDRQAEILRSPSYGGMVLHANVWLHNRRICEVVVLENGIPFSASDTELMDLFVQYVQLHISVHRERYTANADLSAVLMALLEDKSVSQIELINLYSQMGWAVDDELAVLLANTPSGSSTPILAVFRDKLKAAIRESITFSFRDAVVCLINITRSGGYQTIRHQIRKMLSSESLYCGLSFEYTGLERTLEFYHMTQLAVSAAEKQGRKLVDMYSAAPARIMERIHANTDILNLIHPDLLRLDRMDPQRTSHYLETLYAFLLCGGNYTDTANYLGLHRNSLIYRMNRIQGIIRSDLNDVHNKHFLLISYLLMGISF